jgi:hypothetical protein
MKVHSISCSHPTGDLHSKPERKDSGAWWLPTRVTEKKSQFRTKEKSGVKSKRRGKKKRPYLTTKGGKVGVVAEC